MRLAHYGVAHAHEPPLIESSENQLVGIQRGQPYALSYPRHIPTSPSTACPQRGIHRRPAATGSIETMTPAAKIYRQSLAASGQFRLQISQIKLRAAAQAHDENMRRSLNRRLTVAQAKGDRNLIQQLEHEMQTLS